MSGHRLAMLSLHTSPLAQPGEGDSGGMNVYVRELAGAVARRGVDVEVYVRRTSPEVAEVVDVEPGLRVVQIEAGEPDLAKEELPAILECFADEVERRAGSFDPTAVHGNYWLSGVVAHDLKHRLDVPLLVTFHTLGAVKRAMGDDEPRSRIEAERRTIGCADVVLANGIPERDQLVDLYGADRDRVEIVTPGVDRAVFSPGSRAGARRALSIGDGPRALFVGRIQPLKGLDVAVRALARSEHTNLRLSVVGGPSGSDGQRTLVEVRALATELGVLDRIDWHPPQPHHLLSTWYRAADVVVMPSRSESFGLVALEAAACGTPVVATAVGGLRTLVRHGETGFLVEGRDPDGFAHGVDRIIGDTTLAVDLAAATQVVADEHTWSRGADRFVGLLAEVADRALVPCS
ncbi:MAG: glycosyltransferase [Actinomycetota bacterium]